jgi:anthraniloyl-CoA monooxygenase
LIFNSDDNSLIAAKGGRGERGGEVGVRIAVVGGGPGGLYFAALARQLGPDHEITVWERNAPDDTFGFGVVLSDETLGGISDADPAFYAAMEREFARWDDIDVHYRGQVVTSGGHGFAAMSRMRLLQLLQRRCRDLAVTVHFRTEAPSPDELSRTHDLVVASDGVNSAIRSKYADAFRPSLDVRRCKYIWLGTDLVFDAFKFYVVQTPYGVMQIHGYPYDAGGSTFIVEMHDAVWRRAGFDALSNRDFRAGESDHASIQRIQELFAEVLAGHAVLANNSRWVSFTTVRNEAWRQGNVVLLGDAAHSAHFSIGSGTKLAMEDALALAACLHEQPTLDAALTAYQAERMPVVLSTQRAAQASLEWFENLGQYVHQEPMQFAFNIMTRSRRVTYENLRLRDPEFVRATDEWFAAHEVRRGVAPAPAHRSEREGPQREREAPPRPPMFQPFRLRGLELRNRVVVSAMDMYSAVDGVPGDFHLVHLGSKALGGAALVMTEMVCVSDTGRITPGCAGMYAPEHAAGWRRIVHFVHSCTPARIGLQLGHSGRKGSTKLMWEGMDEPLDDDNWAVCGPSPIPYSARNQVPRELTRTELDEIRDQFVQAAVLGERCGFDLLELHCAHGYLLSSFISPLTNRRTDGYGGSLANRLRYPLEVFAAIRTVWPERKPMTVRISATDWCEGGITSDDAVLIARAFADAGADAIDTSTGQVTPEEKPAYGRSYQTPYADRIRNQVGIATIAVGAISSADDVNSIVLAGRADLCALGRAHLYDPQWTLHAAAEQGYAGPGAAWPDPFKAGSRRPQTGRTDGPKPRLQLIREGEPGTKHARWRPTRHRM